MHRFFLSPELTSGPVLVLAEGQAHHAIHVLRLRNHDPVVVLNGVGEELHCEVQELRRDSVTLRLIQKRVLPPLPYRLTLAQAVTKGKSMDLILQKATELGVARIVPLLADRSVAHLEPGSAKLAKWQATTVEAIKQCGSPWLPQVLAPQSIQQFLAGGEQVDLSLLASLQRDTQHPRAYFDQFLAAHHHRPKSVSVWVGPEGDFTPAEVQAIAQAGAYPITLGPLVLRSETAAIYCLSILNYELQAPSPP